PAGVTLPVDAGWLVQAPYAQYLQGNPIRQTPAI
ncbi:SDR family NAD(P)-dependent oxidoreductase, partial [Mesorhizobium sp. M7A.F.Ca.CA.001.12.2.1]